MKVWTNNGDYFSVSHSFPRLVYDAFQKEGITIPFNQLDVHIDSPRKENIQDKDDEGEEV